MWLVYAGAWSFVGALSWTTAAVYLIRDIGMSPLQLVLAGTALEVAYFLCEVPTGVLADLYSRRLSLIVSAVVSGIGMVLVGLAPSPTAVLLAMALWGLGWTFRSGAEDAWLADEVGEERLARAYQRGAQVERLTGLAGIGTAVALAMAALWLPFVVAGCVTGLLSIVLAVAMPEHGFVRPERRGGVAATMGAARATVTAGRRVVLAHPILLLILAIAFVTGAWSEGWDRLWEAHLLVDVGLPRLFGLDDVAWFGVLAAGGLVLSFLVAAPLVSRLERLPAMALPKLLLGLNAVLIVAALGFALSRQLWPTIACYWLTSVLRSLADAPYRTWLNTSITDSSVRATVLSITNLAGSAGEWAGGPTLGWVGTRWSVRAALAVGAIALSPVLVLFGRAAASHRGPALVIPGTTQPSTER